MGKYAALRWMFKAENLLSLVHIHANRVNEWLIFSMRLLPQGWFLSVAWRIAEVQHKR